MANRKFFRKKRGAPKVTKVTKKRSSGIGSKRVVKIVKSIMAKGLERKVLNYTWPAGSVVSAYGGSIFSTQTGITPLSPYTGYLDCVQGLAQNNRIGNRITIVDAKLNLMFTPFGYDVTFNPTPGPLEISVILFYQKQDSTNPPSLLPGLYQNGSSSDSPSSTGALFDTCKQFNNDRWKVFRRKTFKLGFANYGGTGTSAVLQSTANNDFKMNQKISMNYTKYLNKQVKYDDTTLSPFTRGLFMAILVHSADGRLLSNAGKYAYLNGNLQIKYVDA